MFRSFSRFRASSPTLMFCPCRFSFRLFPLFLPPSAFRASTLIGPTHCTSNPVPIPYTPVLHFATKPQHSLSRVEKMSNFALVVPSSIEEGDRFPRVAPIDIHPSHRSKSSRPWTSKSSAPSSTIRSIS